MFSGLLLLLVLVFWVTWHFQLLRLLLPRQLDAVILAFAWSEFKETHTINDKNYLRDLKAFLAKTQKQPGRMAPYQAYWKIILKYSDHRDAVLLASANLEELYEPESCLFWVNPSLQDYLKQNFQEQLGTHFFGEPLPWPAVNPLYPLDSVAEVKDLETSLTFRVKRYGGDLHTDVEPLTTQDAETLKKIHGGAWSWNRRAIVISIADKKVAASMNGMPHGYGTIPDNDFPGHFCIHYLGSRVHTSGKVDPGHQLMVKKAAGELMQAMDQATPEELAVMILAGVQYADKVSVRYAAGELKPDELWQNLATLIRYMTINAVHLLDTDGKTARVAADVTVYFQQPNPDTPYHQTFTINFLHRGPGKGWQVALASLQPLLVQEKKAISLKQPQVPIDIQEAAQCCTPDNKTNH